MSIPAEYVSTRELMQNVVNLKDICDVILVSTIDKQKFPAHRLILMASSKYFAALLGSNFREGTEKEIKLSIDGLMLKTILDFIYTGRIEINIENVGDIIAAASSMELIPLEERCGTFWEANLSTESCVETFLNADKYQLKDLWSKTLKFICDHFESVAIDDIQQIDEKNFQEMLKHDQISAAETIVFDRLVEWMNHNKIEAEVASEMLKSIRLAHIPIAFLTETIEPFFDTYDGVKMVLNEYRERLLNPKAICLNRYATKEIYCSFSNGGLTGINIHKYNFAENIWSESKTISLGAKRYSFGSICLNGELFVMGGFDGTPKYFNNMESYNLKDLSKTSLPNMMSVRSSFTPIAVGKYIYVFGGFSGIKLDACERYDVVNRVWQPRQSIPKAVSSYAIEELNGQIYIFGGNDSQDLYCYYPDTNSWTTKSRIACAKISYPVLAKIDQLLYAIESNGIVHQYEPAQDFWTKLGSLGNTIAISRNLNYYNQIYVVCTDGKFGLLKLERNDCALIPLGAMSSLSTTSNHLFLD